MHLPLKDINEIVAARNADITRLVALGATVVHDKDEWDTRWTTLTDPEGNEFCAATH